MFASSKLPIFDGLVTSDKYHVEDKYGIANSATGIIGDYHVQNLDVCGTTVSYLEGQSANTVHSYEITNIIDVNEVDTITISDITFDFKNRKNLTTK